jgi:hypothetical protein
MLVIDPLRDGAAVEGLRVAMVFFSMQSPS